MIKTKLVLTTPGFSLDSDIIKLQHSTSTLEDRKIPGYDCSHEDTKNP